MNIDKKIKGTLVLIVIIVVGYVAFNQLFYNPPEPPTIIEPSDPKEQDDTPPSNDEEEDFDGIYVERIPYVDISNEVMLVHEVSQAFVNPLSMYQWEQTTMPVYKKENHDIEKLNEIASGLYQTIDIEKDELTCSALDQDNWEVVVCEFEQGYIEVVQDGSFYIILHNVEEVKIDSYDIDYIERVIEESWLFNIIPWNEYEVVLERIHYDSVDQEIVDISIVEKTDEKYKEKLMLNFSQQHSSITGLSKTADRGEKIMDVDIISMDSIDGLIEEGKYESILVDQSNINEIEVLGYELLYDETTFKDAITPRIHVLTTSLLDSYVNCFEAQGIVVHPLKVMATSELYIRIR